MIKLHAIRCKNVRASSLPCLLRALSPLLLFLAVQVSAQEHPVAPIPSDTPQAKDPQTPPGIGPGGAAPGSTIPAAPSIDEHGKVPIDPRPVIEYGADELDEMDQATGAFRAHGNVTIRYQRVQLSADRVEGNFNTELVFSGNARIERSDFSAKADAIHFYPRSRSYRLENMRGLVQPEALQGKVLTPVFLNSESLYGTRSGYSETVRDQSTTCIEEHHHYELRARDSTLYPGRKLVMRRVGIILFGVKILEVPSITIPLTNNESRGYRNNYLPEFGRNINEGYYGRFPYSFAVGAAAATFLRLDATEKRGMGYRIEQEYLAGKQSNTQQESSNSFGNMQGSGLNLPGADFTGSYTTATGYGNLGSRLPRLGTGLGPQNGGLFAMQGYFNDGFDNNFNASYRHQQAIGGGNRFALSSEYQRNSFYSYSNQTSQTSRFSIAHNDSAHGSNGEIDLGLVTNESAGFGTNQLTGSLRQTYDFDSRGSTRNSLGINFDLNRYLTTQTDLVSRSARLDSHLTYTHTAREFNYGLNYEKNSPIGIQTGGGSFGTLERLPELQFSMDTVNFRGGWLKQLPMHMEFGSGRYSEPGSNTLDDRYLVNLVFPDETIMRGRTEMTTGGGFEQRFYGDGAAQYVLRNTTRLRQHLGKRSGIDLSYQYQQPEGGTPFLFDTFGRTHSLNAEAGYMDDQHFQLTARVGYDFLGSNQLQPWQSMSTRLMWRPTNRFRLDALAIFDPNTSKFFAATAGLRFRGRGDFAVDLFTRYDPTVGRFSQLNSQFSIPFAKSWRVAGLLRYNGLTGRLDSTNLQLTHTWDCMEASATYTETPTGFRNDKSLFFLLRITAFPFFRSFARGPAGESLGAGVGDFF